MKTFSKGLDKSNPVLFRTSFTTAICWHFATCVMSIFGLTGLLCKNLSDMNILRCQKKKRDNLMVHPTHLSHLMFIIDKLADKL